MTESQDKTPVRSFRDLLVWRKARALVRNVYTVTRAFPADERFGLTNQLRRSAVPVPSNIAEGYGRGQRRDYVRYLQIARGSLFELQTQLLLAGDLGYITEADAENCVEEAQAVFGLLQRRIRSLDKTEQ